MPNAAATNPAIRRKPVNLSLPETLIVRAKRITPNLSGTVETLLTEYVREAEARRRAADTELEAVIDALNAAHDAHGLLSDEFCDWL